MQYNSMPSFKFESPDTLNGVLELLKEYGDKAKIIAGGTDVVPKLKARVFEPECIISLKNVNELRYVNYVEGEGLHIGSMTSIRKVENMDVVKEKYPALYEGAHAIASTQVRNLGTLVGNICNAVPSADSAPGLLVLNASVKVASPSGNREIELKDFFAGVCKTVLRPDEVVTELFVPEPEENEKSIYYPYTLRRALDLAMVGVAASGIIENNVVKKINIALGAVAVVPKHAETAEKMLEGKELTEELINEAAIAASEIDCSPISDLRASAEYRREIVRVLTRDAIQHLAGMKVY